MHSPIGVCRRSRQWLVRFVVIVHQQRSAIPAIAFVVHAPHCHCCRCSVITAVVTATSALRPPPTALEQDYRTRVAYVLTPLPPLYLSPPLLFPRG